MTVIDEIPDTIRTLADNSNSTVTTHGQPLPFGSACRLQTTTQSCS